MWVWLKIRLIGETESGVWYCGMMYIEGCHLQGCKIKRLDTLKVYNEIIKYQNQSICVITIVGTNSLKIRNYGLLLLECEISIVGYS